ncbi:hypothetical protein BLNAU_16626 [Blattamonas nauphoetae]|uniref:Protein kinase domain-containing protein n=1 Tax=Blattamonas nauphoetae TaxID=2049346 RepID=A0ABQ9XDS8_9EUKA|nr:hypothetical protein BLNAU_16626 [Blattamonas nauphoetae]
MRPHMFISIPLIVSLFCLTFCADPIPETNLLNLKPILEELTEARTSNIGHRNEPIHLHGQYHLFEYVVRSVNMSIVGAQSTSIVWNKAEDSQDISNTEPSSMLIVTNSTVGLSSLRLICHGDHSSVATIIQSSLSVSNCEINPASNSSPFLSTCTPADTSMLSIFNTQVNWKQATSLPLVGTIPHNHKSLVSESSENNIFLSDTSPSTGVLSIVGSGLSFSNTALPLATGPLFDFGLNENNTQQSLLAASVSLTTSVMTNVTSRRRFIRDTLRFPLASQRLISLSISECTNHLYGCGCLDMNLGSALCCQNSSFSKCKADAEPTEGPPTVYLQHRTTMFDQNVYPAYTQFDSCTFRDMSGYQGGAIANFKAGTSLSVTKCSFVRCSAETHGGSVYFYPSTPTIAVAVSHCSFMSGSTLRQGGAIQLSNCVEASITDCVFYDLHAGVYGGGLMLYGCNYQNPVSNCLFQKCSKDSSTGSGGAVHSYLSAFTYTSLRFRENRASTLDRGHDVSAQMNAATHSFSSFTDCDTDQEIIRIYFIDYSITPNLETASNSLTVSSVSCVVSSDNRTAKSALTVDQPISGTVLMLVDNTNGYEMPNDDESPPPINRMISFAFSSDSTSTESDLSFGEWELLQFESNYSLVAFGWKDSIVDTNSVVLTTPNPPRIVRAMCEGGDSEFDAFVSLKARTLATGSYKASVKNIPGFWIFVDFVNNPSGGNIFSTKFGLKLQGDDAFLDFGMTYEIDEVIEILSGESLILDPPRRFFTTPSRPTLKSVGTISFSDSKKDTITVKLVGENLFANPYTLTVSDGSSTSTVTAVFDADGVDGAVTAVLYSMDGSKTVELAFGTTYTITGFTCPGSAQPILTPNLQIVVPAEPARVEKIVSTKLISGQTQFEVTFQARAVPSTITSVAIKDEDPSVFVSATRLSDTSFSALFHVAETASQHSLAFSETYSIASVSNGVDFVLNTAFSFTVPSNARLTEIGTTFSNDVNTGLTFTLQVEGSIHDSTYKLTLSDNTEVEVECSLSTLACSSIAPIRVGWETGFQYKKDYTLSKMVEVGGTSQRVDLDENTFTTDAKPTQPVFHVDESGDLSDFCGDDGDECKTIDEAWRIVNGIGFPRPTLLIMDSTTLDSPIAVTEGMRVIVTNGTLIEPKLYVASHDLSGSELGMIVVDSAFLELKNVDVHILSASPAFVVIHGTNSELVFHEGLFAGPLAGMTRNEDSDGVCSWSSGALQLMNCETHLRTTQLYQLSQGAINMKNGSLEILTSSFVSNSASSSSFPSSRRNIHCSNKGTVTIGSLNGGDGFQGSSLWASMEDCVMNGDAAQPDSPLFVPQLDKERSKSVFDTSTKQYTVSIVGSRLIPCGLFLEVFEFTSESNADGNSMEIELNHTSSDTVVTVVIDQEKITTLDQKYELRCRLKFGKNLRTTDWFTFSAAHIDDPEPTDPEPTEPEPTKPKFSQTPLGKALSWILPLVISVVLLLIILLVIFLVWRRKRQPKQQDKAEMAEEQETDEYLAKGDVVDIGLSETQNIVAVNQHKGETTNNEPKSNLPSTRNDDCVEVLRITDDISQKDIVETKFIATKETLFHRLHEAQNPKPIETEKIQKALTEQLLRLMQKMPTAQVFQNLNPHWVIIENDTEVHFKLVDNQTRNQSLGNQMNYANGGDSQRWNPPEESEEKNESEQKSTNNKEAGLVFRLGILLWEIETGQVPYREHDGLNAHRQIVLGVGLKMNAVENEALRDLIEDCMQIEPKNRPTLQKVKDRLFKCFSPSGSEPTLAQQNNKAESNQ